MFYWISLTLIGLIFLTVFSAVVFPRLILKIYSAFIVVKDREISRFTLSDGVSVLFEPNSTDRRFFDRYQICQFIGRRYKCFFGELAQNLSSVEYSVIAYHRRNTVKRVYRVKEQNCQKFSRTTCLPEETDYVSVIVHKANGNRIYHEHTFNPIGYLWLALFGFAIASVLDALFWIVLRFVSYLQGHGVQDVLSLKEWGIILPATMLGMAGLCVTVMAIINLFLNRRTEKNSRLKNGKAKGFIGKLVSPFCMWFGRFCQICRKCCDILRNFFLRLLWSKPVLKIKHVLLQVFYKTKFCFRRLFRKAR